METQHTLKPVEINTHTAPAALLLHCSAHLCVDPPPSFTFSIECSPFSPSLCSSSYWTLMNSSFLLYSYLLLYLLLSPNFYSPINFFWFIFVFISPVASSPLSWFHLCSFFLIYLLLMSPLVSSPFSSFLYSPAYFNTPLIISTDLSSTAFSCHIFSLHFSFPLLISLFLCLFLICSFIFPLYPLLLFLLSSGLLSPSFFPASFQSFLQSEALEFFCTHCHKQISRLEDLSTRLQLLEMNR